MQDARRTEERIAGRNLTDSSVALSAPTSMTKAAAGLKHLFRKPKERRYVESVMRKLAQGDTHSTLGNNLHDEAYTRDRAALWSRHLIDFGLRPEHVCIEYGCGSLRAAEPVIRYLDPGRFFGLDVTCDFYAFGVQRIGDLVAEKRVRLAVISRRSLREAAGLRPDFIFSRKVLSHVNKESLPRYLENIARMMAPKTVAVLDNTPTRDARGNITGRRHTVEQVRAHLPPWLDIRQERYAAVVRHRG
jgi:hypothetical protein